MEANYAYGAHFALRVLVLPVLPLRKQEYARQLALLRKHSRIALADIPPATTAGVPVNALIAPTPASRGFLNLNFVEAWDPDLVWLNEFQIHRKVMGVIGLLDCAEWTGQDGDGDLQDGARVFREIMKEQAPAEVFASRCYAFNPRETQNDNAEGLVVIPNVGDLDFYVNTLLSELSSNMLAGISRILGTLDSKTSIQMPMGRPTFITLPTYQPSATPSTPGTERSSLSVSGAFGFERSNSPLSNLPTSRPPSVAPAPSSPAGAHESSDAKARKKHPGRIAKLKGDLLCLAGKTQEAMAFYNEATIIGRATNDFAWQAAAIEANIMTQAYQSWLHATPTGSSGMTPRPSISGVAALRADPPVSSASTAALAKELPPRYTEALSLYLRTTANSRNSASVGFDSQSTPPVSGGVPLDTDSIIHPLLYIESCMRFLRLQLILLLRGDLWDGRTANMLVDNGSSSWPQLSATEIFRQSLQGSVTRADVEATVALAYGQASSPSLRRQDRIRFLEAISQIYESLHLCRRQAVIAREISVLLSTEVAQDEVHATEMDLAADISVNHGGTMVKSRGHAEGADRVLEIIAKACKAYGLPDADRESKVGASYLPPENILVELNIIFERYGWLELQHALVKEAIRICKVLPDLAGASIYTALALRRTLDALASNEQRSYIEDIRQMNGAAEKRGISPAYWGPDYLLLSLSLLSLPEPMRVVEQVVAPGALEEASGQEKGFSDILVHSVVRKQAAGGATSVIPTLVQGEPGEVTVVLANPYSINIQLDSIELICQGMTCAKFPPVSISLPPFATQSVTLISTPLDAGDLKIMGCRVRLAGCPEREFLLPANAAARGEEILRAFGPSILEHGRTKQASFESWHETRQDLLDAYNQLDDSTFLTCKVIAKQPLLHLRELSLAHGIAMLCEGETSLIRAILHNSTDIEINSLKMTLEDNVTTYQTQRITSDDVSPQMTHELELDMQQLPVLQLSEEVPCNQVSPNDQLTVAISCRGKPGLTHGALSIEYASLSAHSEDGPIERFYTRTLRIPFAFSVHPCLKCRSWDILRLSRYPTAAKRQHRRNMSVTSVGRALAIDEELEDQLRNVDDQTSCLLVLEVENTSTRQAFEAVLTGSDAIGAKVKERIEPNTTINLLLPITKLRLSEEQIRQAIPSPGNKQFVVGKGILPLQELERFWYREELLRNIQLDWREVGSRRSGACNVRHLSLSDEMLAAIKLSDMPLTIEVIQDGEACPQDDEDRWSVSEGAFVEMTVSVMNLKARSLTLLALIEVEEADETVNLQDYRNADIDAVKRNVSMDGVPLMTMPAIGAGEELEEPLSYSLSFMSKGLFSIKVRLDEIVEQGIVSGKSISSPSIPRACVEQSVRFNVS